jgi:hypothetical protein
MIAFSRASKVLQGALSWSWARAMAILRRCSYNASLVSAQRAWSSAISLKRNSTSPNPSST